MAGKTVIKATGVMLIALLVLNFILFIFGQVKVFTFWMVIIVVGILTFVLTWANRRKNK